MGELCAFHPEEYLDYRMKYQLIRSMSDVDRIDHMLEKCRESPDISYEECAVYLRRIFILLTIRTKQTDNQDLCIPERSNPKTNQKKRIMMMFIKCYKYEAR